MANWYTSAHPKLFQQSAAVAGTLVVLGLGCGVYLGWDTIARRSVPYVAVGDAETLLKDITYQTVSVSTLSGLKRCRILLDTGSVFNWMSIEAAAEMDVPIEPVTEQEASSCSAIDASGNEVVPLGKVAVTWFWEGRYTPHTTVFYVGLRGASFMTFGSYYLLNNRIFSYNKKFVLPLWQKGKKGDKARDDATHAAQNAKSEKDMEEKDAQRNREYETFQKKNAGGPSSQGNNTQGGSGSSGTTS